MLWQEARHCQGNFPVVWTEQNGGRLGLLDPRGFSRFMQVINSTLIMGTSHLSAAYHLLNGETQAKKELRAWMAHLLPGGSKMPD